MMGDQLPDHVCEAFDNVKAPSAMRGLAAAGNVYELPLRVITGSPTMEAVIVPELSASLTVKLPDWLAIS